MSSPVSSTNPIVASNQVSEPVKVGKQPNFCPTNALKALHGTTFAHIENFFFNTPVVQYQYKYANAEEIETREIRFNSFKPLDPMVGFARKDDGSFRTFEAEGLTPDTVGLLCNKTIMLKSIINAIMSLKEVIEVCNIRKPVDGVYDSVIIEEVAGEKTEYQQALVKRVNKFADYLNTYAGKVHAPENATSEASMPQEQKERKEKKSRTE